LFESRVVRKNSLGQERVTFSLRWGVPYLHKPTHMGVVGKHRGGLAFEKWKLWPR